MNVSARWFEEDLSQIATVSSYTTFDVSGAGGG